MTVASVVEVESSTANVAEERYSTMDSSIGDACRRGGLLSQRYNSVKSRVNVSCAILLDRDYQSEKNRVFRHCPFVASF